jgi:hypothetical protein
MHLAVVTYMWYKVYLQQRVRDLSNQISALGFLFFLASVFLWMELGVVRRDTISPDKAVVGVSGMRAVERS